MLNQTKLLQPSWAWMKMEGEGAERETDKCTSPERDPSPPWWQPDERCHFQPRPPTPLLKPWVYRGEEPAPNPARPPTLANQCIFAVGRVASIQPLSRCALGVSLPAAREQNRLSVKHPCSCQSPHGTILVLFTGRALTHTSSASHTLIAVGYGRQRGGGGNKSNENERRSEVGYRGAAREEGGREEVSSSGTIQEAHKHVNWQKHGGKSSNGKLNPL